jgi:Na+-translocating ferredoxin:NAD+ oxidoreductase RnfE subunit
MTKDPMVACVIAVVGAMIMMSIKQYAPHIFWGILITLLIYGCQALLKQSGFSWKKK